MKKLSQNEAKKNLILMLKQFDDFCRYNNIKYSLIGGSLIGTIRHKGMIPWDDDIDIIMVKSEYDKLIGLLSKTNYFVDDNKYNFINYQNNDSYYYPYLKMVDTSTIIHEEKFREINNYGEYIDIFYYTYVPEQIIKRKMHWFKIQIGKAMISGYATKNISKDDKYYLIKKIGRLFVSIFGIKNILKWYGKNIDKYNKKKTKYFISNWPCYNMQKETQISSIFDQYMDSEFDGINAMIIKDYDILLTNTFGNYMELPPVDKRVNHGLVVYKKGE